MITEISSPLLTDQDWWWRTYFAKNPICQFHISLSWWCWCWWQKQIQGISESQIDFRILGNLCRGGSVQQIRVVFCSSKWFPRNWKFLASFQRSPMIQGDSAKGFKMFDNFKNLSKRRRFSLKSQALVAANVSYMGNIEIALISHSIVAQYWQLSLPPAWCHCLLSCIVAYHCQLLTSPALVLLPASLYYSRSLPACLVLKAKPGQSEKAKCLFWSFEKSSSRIGRA